MGSVQFTSERQRSVGPRRSRSPARERARPSRSGRSFRAVMGNVNSWHVALSLTFVVGFLMTVVIEAWRNTGMVPVGHSIRFAASRIPWASSGSTESTIRRHAASHDRSFIPYDDAPAAHPAAHSHHGSWVIATAAFLLIAFRQTDVLPYVPLGLSPSTFHSGRRRLPVASHPRDGTAVLVSHWRARARPVHLRIGRPIRLRRPDDAADHSA